MDLGLKDKVALVTGAGSQIGFGRAIAVTLAKEGCNIISADMDLEGAQKTAEEVKALGVKAIAVKADISNNDEVQEMVKASIAEFGRIDILVNNAGTPGGGVPNSEEQWDKTVNVNFKGTWYVTNAVAPYMREQKYGKIVNFSSAVARAGIGGIYAAAKEAVIGLTKAWARELGPMGVNVNGIAPGMGDTGFQILAHATREQQQGYINSVPMRRLTMPQDIANTVTFLVSDVSVDITGQTIEVDGGDFMI
ncbi:MAG: SDR family oxidoreductase [Dehalococcoidales bacterium]|nr:SDR family oxidoreductase [Dehalococcoidales bacterium]